MIRRYFNSTDFVLAGIGLCVVWMGGCAHTQPDPAFAATRPPAAAPQQQNGGAIYQAGYSMFLFEDQRARRVGDILTVVLTETTSATKEANTSTDKTNEVAIANPKLFGYTLPHGTSPTTLENSLSSEQKFEGKGSSKQNNSLAGTISVTVFEVQGNGNLMVRGEKMMTLNQGDEYVRISGIVRPQDIRPDNTVLSTQVADARIVYSGRGSVAESNAIGWLGRFFLGPLWPF